MSYQRFYKDLLVTIMAHESNRHPTRAHHEPESMVNDSTYGFCTYAV